MRRRRRLAASAISSVRWIAGISPESGAVGAGASFAGWIIPIVLFQPDDITRECLALLITLDRSAVFTRGSRFSCRHRMLYSAAQHALDRTPPGGIDAGVDCRCRLFRHCV